ncbi:hypothetical protein EG329_012740 [Mollisiaceae sp. DMI_Dod_QoI]|nr:hypothetical protein EG329_012740 [Helotiales sp. DMI_Dod_QoI]
MASSSSQLNYSQPNRTLSAFPPNTFYQPELNNDTKNGYIGSEIEQRIPRPLPKAKCAPCQQCIHTSVQLETIRSRLAVLEHLAFNPGSKTTAPIWPNSESNQAAQSDGLDNAPLCSISDTTGSLLSIGSEPDGRFTPQDSGFAVGANAQSHSAAFAVGDHMSQQHSGPTDEDIFDLFDFNGASDTYYSDAQPNVAFVTGDVHDFQAVNVGFDFQMNVPSGSAPSSQNSFLPVPPPTTAAAVATVALPRARIPCNFCPRTFGRTGDLNRHELKHNPNAQRYPCPEPSCKYSGTHGMLRKDKLQAHRARSGH